MSAQTAIGRSESCCSTFQSETEKRFKVGSGCWLQISPSESGPPKTRGSCCSLPELQPMLKIAPIAAPACSIEIDFRGGKAKTGSPAGTECSLGALWIVGQLSNQRATICQAAALDDTSAARVGPSLCILYNQYFAL